MDFMGLFQRYFVDTLKNHYVDFEGRATRSEYWYFALFQAILTLTLSILAGIFSSIGPLGVIFSLLRAIVGLALFLPSLGLGVRRLHDLGKSGWFLLLGCIPLIGAIVLLVWFCTKGEDQPNAWGEPRH